jgi:hypothetical protein
VLSAVTLGAPGTEKKDEVLASVNAHGDLGACGAASHAHARQNSVSVGQWR